MSSEVPMDMLSKLSVVSPSNMYYYLNDFFEYSLISIGNEYGMGMAIVAITVGIKLIYTPVMVKTTLNTLKLKLLDPET